MAWQQWAIMQDVATYNMAKDIPEKIDDRTPYQKETQRNEWEFSELVKQARPEIWTLMNALDTTGVNYLIILKIIRHLTMIAVGNKYGEVTIKIENGTVTFVHGTESDRINEKILIKDTGMDKYSY